jgi:hypothetical protein
MPTPEDTRDSLSNEPRLDRASFLRFGLISVGVYAALRVASFRAHKYSTVAGTGYQMHEQYGHPIGTSELRDRVERLFVENGRPDEEWIRRYDLVSDAIDAGDASRLPEKAALWEEKGRRFGFEATYARLFGHDPRYERICDWKSVEVCYDYVFEILRREGDTYRVPHDSHFADAMQQMGYIPVQESQDFDIVMYYRPNMLSLEVEPTHWGMMQDGQVISKNFAEDYVMRHNVDAILKDERSMAGPTHFMFFRKADPKLCDPRVLPLTGRAAHFVEFKGAMVPREYLEMKANSF